MPTLTLTAADVSSFQKLDAVVGSIDGPRQLLIFTGIAATHWDSNGSLDPLRVVVRFGVTLPEKPRKNEWTAVVGLSNIDSRDSDFVFALNTADVGIDPQTNELELTVELAVQGDGGHAVLSSFSYQVSVLTKPPQIELESLLVGPDIENGSLSGNVSVGTGERWRGRVSLTSPAPRNVDVFLFTGNAQVAPLRFPGDPSVSSVTIAQGERFSGIFRSAPTSNAGAVIVDVSIRAAVVAGAKSAVVGVLPIPQ